MLRIVGIQKSTNHREEFVLIQNHSSFRLKLRGHVIMADSFLSQENPDAMYAFADEELIHSGAFVLLRTGSGIPRWVQTKDGSAVYYCYIGRTEPIWSNATGPVHVLNIQHSFEERLVSEAPGMLLA